MTKLVFLLAALVSLLGAAWPESTPMPSSVSTPSPTSSPAASPICRLSIFQEREGDKMVWGKGYKVKFWLEPWTPPVTKLEFWIGFATEIYTTYTPNMNPYEVSTRSPLPPGNRREPNGMLASYPLKFTARYTLGSGASADCAVTVQVTNPGDKLHHLDVFVSPAQINRAFNSLESAMAARPDVVRALIEMFSDASDNEESFGNNARPGDSEVMTAEVAEAARLIGDILKENFPRFIENASMGPYFKVSLYYPNDVAAFRLISIAKQLACSNLDLVLPQLPGRVARWGLRRACNPKPCRRVRPICRLLNSITQRVFHKEVTKAVNQGLAQGIPALNEKIATVLRKFSVADQVRVVAVKSSVIRSRYPGSEIYHEVRPGDDTRVLLKTFECSITGNFDYTQCLYLNLQPYFPFQNP